MGDLLAAYLDRVINDEAWASSGEEAADHIRRVLGFSEDQRWAETILSQRDAALEAIARVRALLDDDNNPWHVVKKDAVRRALDGEVAE